MFKLIFPRAPTYAEVVERLYAEAEIMRLHASAEHERAAAERDRANATFQRLARERDILHANKRTSEPTCTGAA